MTPITKLRKSKRCEDSDNEDDDFTMKDMMTMMMMQNKTEAAQKEREFEMRRTEMRIQSELRREEMHSQREESRK